MTHQLKTDPEPFREVLDGHKTFELRFNDRNFQTGNIIILRQTRYSQAEMACGKPLEYTGAEVRKIAGYILREGYGLPSGYCIISLL